MCCVVEVSYNQVSYYITEVRLYLLEQIIEFVWILLI